MDIIITPPAEASRQVSVVFTDGDVTHSRSVNACFKSDGTYDDVATAARVDEVGAGVAIKIGLGVIKTDPPAEPQA